jgi:hypothetical protein
MAINRQMNKQVEIIKNTPHKRIANNLCRYSPHEEVEFNSPPHKHGIHSVTCFKRAEYVRRGKVT